MAGIVFWHVCTSAVTTIAVLFDFFSHSRKQTEKIKNGHAMTSPHVGTAKEWKIAHTAADPRAMNS
ncbi:MAG: hypothetical protein JW837_02685 [Sedimentisphaerales bacterium]|nr:hypothetical protein [Sedimentisphaerales bacterium]